MTPSTTTTQEQQGVAVRPAQKDDLAFIVSLIRELAAYEKLSGSVECSEGDIESALFAAQPKVFCEIAELDGRPVGFAIWFYSFSTFRGRHGLWLEDLFVRPDVRGRGLGKALLQHLARRCVQENLPRMDWSVLDWNTPSIEFYKARGALLLDDWTTCRLTDETLAAVAEGR